MCNLKPSLRQFLFVWFGLGVQSFGGGAATLALIRREVVDKHGWLTPDEFTRDWALCQVSPGINLLGITTLIGRRVLGIPGIAIALFGLLFPSCLITVLITAAYARVHNLAVVREALNGIIPATVGIGVVLAYQLSAPLLMAAWREGRASLAFNILVIVGCGAAVLVFHPTVVAVLAVASGASALFYWTRAKVRKWPPNPQPWGDRTDLIDSLGDGDDEV